MKTCIVLPSSKIFQASISHEWTARWINHGVALLLSYTKKQGFDVDLVDTRRCSDWFIFELIIRKYDVVCFSVNTIDYPIYLQCLEHLKKVNPLATVIVGGVHPTIKINDFMNDKRVNFIIQKEGESSLVYLLHCLRSGVKNVNRVIVGKQVNLDLIPPIDRSLWLSEFPWGLKFSGKPPFITILTSRACTQNCSFCQPCAKEMFGVEERRRSVRNVVLELNWLKEHEPSFNSWMIHDDGFLQNIDWVKAFIKEYWKIIGLPKPFIIQTRANYPIQHPEVFSELKKLGLEMAIVGFESGSNNVLKIMRKGITREINIEGAKILHDNGIKIFANIMFGVPGETLIDVKETMSMVREINPEHFSASTYSPYPGNDLHDFCQKQDLILNEYANRYPGEQKIKGIDYCAIQKEIDLYNREHNRLKFWLQHSNLPGASKARKLYHTVRAKVA
jgi:anaerobic magnesium-protoporphyrin IX monomethyl ester cyclase